MRSINNVFDVDIDIDIVGYVWKKDRELHNMKFYERTLRV